MRTAHFVILFIAAGVLVTTGFTTAFKSSDKGFSSASSPTAPLLPSGDPECGYDADIPAVDDFMRLITFGDPYMGNFDADVTVIEYFDPNCPHCKTMNPIMNNVLLARGEKARFFKVPYVLWQYSLMQVEALFVAGQDGKYFDMLNAQYEHQQAGGMNLDELTVLAREIGLDTDVFRARVERGMNQGMILARRQEIIDMGIRGTPAVMINGRVIDSQSKSFECIVELIDKVAAEAAD